MPALEARLRAQLPNYGYPGGVADPPWAALAAYLDLVMRWNRRVRLVGTEEIELLINRHLGESLYLGQCLDLPSTSAPQPPETARLLDIGSGAGFPGLALAIAYPGLTATLVEANEKKAAFLRAAVRECGLASHAAVINIYQAPLEKNGNHESNGRAAEESRSPASGDSGIGRFPLVTCRALERMSARLPLIASCLAAGGCAALWVTREQAMAWQHDPACNASGWEWRPPNPIPGSVRRVILIGALAAARMVSRETEGRSRMG